MSFTSDQLDWLNRELRAIHDRIDQAMGLVSVDPHLVELANGPDRDPAYAHLNPAAADVTQSQQNLPTSGDAASVEPPAEPAPAA